MKFTRGKNSFNSHSVIVGAWVLNVNFGPNLHMEKVFENSFFVIYRVRSCI